MPYQNPPQICPVCKEKADFKFIKKLKYVYFLVQKSDY
jgi:hypothetical protein